MDFDILKLVFSLTTRLYSEKFQNFSLNSLFLRANTKMPGGIFAENFMAFHESTVCSIFEIFRFRPLIWKFFKTFDGVNSWKSETFVQIKYFFLRNDDRGVSQGLKFDGLRLLLSFKIKLIHQNHFLICCPFEFGLLLS